MSQESSLVLAINRMQSILDVMDRGDYGMKYLDQGCSTSIWTRPRLTDLGPSRTKPRFNIPDLIFSVCFTYFRLIYNESEACLKSSWLPAIIINNRIHNLQHFRRAHRRDNLENLKPKIYHSSPFICTYI